MDLQLNSQLEKIGQLEKNELKLKADLKNVSLDKFLSIISKKFHRLMFPKLNLLTNFVKLPFFN
jgi:hypothetical protein